MLPGAGRVAVTQLPGGAVILETGSDPDALVGVLTSLGVDTDSSDDPDHPDRVFDEDAALEEAHFAVVTVPALE